MGEIMEIKKICAKCGKETSVFHSDKTIDVKESLNKGADLYFSLWNFEIEKCEHCGFSSRDISKPLNFEIDKAEEQKILNNQTLIEFYEERPHKIFDYLIAGLYYKASKDILNQALCILQAGDLFYMELMYFADDVLDGIQDEEVESLQKIGEELYKKASDLLKKYVDTHATDNLHKLLLAGVLGEMDTAEKIQSNLILKSLKDAPLNNDEKLIYQFLCG